MPRFARGRARSCAGRDPWTRAACPASADQLASSSAAVAERSTAPTENQASSPASRVEIERRKTIEHTRPIAGDRPAVTFRPRRSSFR